MTLSQWLFGRPLRSDEERQEQLDPAAAIPVLGLDALASAAYGPEAALTVLLPAGIAATLAITSITNWILLVLLAIFLSYRQTIAAYPDGGGSYTVAKQNLGALPGIVAASALCTDYVLNAAVAISAGVGAIVSAVPSLLPYTLPLCLAVLAFLTIINLRGVRAVGAAFMAPTYAFVGCLAATILLGFARTVLADEHPVTATAAGTPQEAAVSTWLFLRAFASGCTALTGVEAVSNAVPIFREPRVKLAQRTLLMIVATLAFLLIGIAWLGRAYHIQATVPGAAGYESVISQLVRTVAGRGYFYYATLSVVLAVLALSANTSFADFPRVCRLLALDGFLPPDFAHRGRRLVYTHGVVVLALASFILLVAFAGITERLIPLFAVGAFLAFTMSQVGMVVHWRTRLRERGAWPAMLVNGAGALATSAALAIIVVSKFTEGAWLTVLVIPGLVIGFTAIRRYHDRLGEAVNETGPVDFSGLTDPIAVVPILRLDRVARKGLRFGLTIASEVYVVQVLAEQVDADDLTRHWHALVEEPAARLGSTPPRLVVVRSPYREFIGPFLEWVERCASEHPDRSIAVVVPELTHRRWYHFLESRRATLLKSLLLLRGGRRVAIVTIPWYVPEEDDDRD